MTSPTTTEVGRGRPDLEELAARVESGAKRVQLSRRKGWRLPPNTVRVSRPGPFGNPFSREAAIESEYATEATWRAFVVECFRDWLGPSQSGRDWWQGPKSDERRKAIIDGLPTLRGKNLACWCRADEPCHADVLLELANRPVCEALGPAALRAMKEEGR